LIVILIANSIISEGQWIQKIRRKDQAWWSTPVIPATLEVETGGSWLEVRAGNISETSSSPPCQK
jgi:hypothetical protein